jgi:NitT/TauT family transport system substrate-binding protein
MNAITRRVTLGLAALAAPMLGRAQTLKPASLRLDWALSGYHVPFFWAKEKGYFAAEGIDLEIRDGAGSAKAASLVSSKEDTFGMVEALVTANSIARGMKLRSIYMVVQNGGAAIVSWAAKPMKTPQDMVGRSLAAAADQKPQLDLLLAMNGIPSDKVTLRVVAVAARNQVFFQGQVEGIVSTVIGSPMDMIVAAREGRGQPIHIMPFSDFGVRSLAQGFVVHEDLARENPEQVRGFLRACTKGIRDCMAPGNLDAATDIAMQLSRAPSTRRESVKLQWEATIPRLWTEANKDKPLGWTSEADWANLVDLLLKQQAIPAAVPANTLFTNAFIPA